MKQVYKYNPSGEPSFFRYRTLSFDFLKSSLVTFIRRSRNAIRPASVQIACKEKSLFLIFVRQFINQQKIIYLHYPRHFSNLAKFITLFI